MAACGLETDEASSRTQSVWKNPRSGKLQGGLVVKRTSVKRIARLVPLLTTFAALSCSILDEETVLETRLTLTVDQSPKAVGEDFTFTYSAQGTALSRIVVEFGDGEVDADSTFFGGASETMDGVMLHAYDSAGSYTVTGWIEDLAVGADTVILMVDVTN